METVQQAFFCLTCKQVVELRPSPGNPGRAGAEGGLQSLCTIQVKRSEAGEAIATENKKQTFLLESSSCILKIHIFSNSGKKINGNFKKSFQSYNLPLVFLLRKKSGVWEEMLMGGVSGGVSGVQEQDAAARPQHNYLISLSRENSDKTILTKEGKFKALLINTEWE